jgi:hypothetical protein
MLLTSVAPVRADANALSALLSCQPAPGPGRVVCEIEGEVSGGVLDWADAVVVSAPDFAPPLRDRVSLKQARARTQTRVRLPIALLADRLGQGTLEVRLRVVVCPSLDVRTCLPMEKTASATVRVGPERAE